jgi:hypothetical protein
VRAEGRVWHELNDRIRRLEAWVGGGSGVAIEMCDEGLPFTTHGTMNDSQ